MEHNIIKIVRLKNRADFLRVAKTSRRFAAPGLVLQAATRKVDASELKGCKSRKNDKTEAVVGIGFTASKKVGNAVARNRAKRRLRAAVAAVMPKRAKGGDYVIIGRKRTLDRPFAALLTDLIKALRRTDSLTQKSVK